MGINLGVPSIAKDPSLPRRVESGTRNARNGRESRGSPPLARRLSSKGHSQSLGGYSDAIPLSCVSCFFRAFRVPEHPRGMQAACLPVVPLLSLMPMGEHRGSPLQGPSGRGRPPWLPSSPPLLPQRERGWGVRACPRSSTSPGTRPPRATPARASAGASRGGRPACASLARRRDRPLSPFLRAQVLARNLAEPLGDCVYLLRRRVYVHAERRAQPGVHHAHAKVDGA